MLLSPVGIFSSFLQSLGFRPHLVSSILHDHFNDQDPISHSSSSAYFPVLESKPGLALLHPLGHGSEHSGPSPQSSPASFFVGITLAHVRGARLPQGAYAQQRALHRTECRTCRGLCGLVGGGAFLCDDRWSLSEARATLKLKD